MEENKKIEVKIAEGITSAEIVIREGEAPKQLEIKAPVKTDIKGTIGVVKEFLKHRLNKDQFEQARAYIEVCREDIYLKLIINENDEYLRGEVIGKLSLHSAFIAFGINTSKMWLPTELGLFCKMNRAYFADKQANMALVTELMNYKAQIESKIERSVSEKGDKTDNFSQVVNSNLPKAFKLRMPIYKGGQDETIEVETFAQVNGREVAFALLSPAAAELIENIRNLIIDEELKVITEIAPEIAIIEV